MKHKLFRRRSHLEAPAEEVFSWHARAGAFERLNPPWDPAEVSSRSGGIEDEGSRVELRVGPLRQRWVAEHFGCQPGREFRDRQLSGPFAFWQHVHRMVPDGESASFLEDEIEYALPGGAAGDLFGGGLVRSLLERMLKAVLGQMADATLLASTRVRPDRLLWSGYRFRFPDLEGALRHLPGEAAS